MLCQSYFDSFPAYVDTGRVGSSANNVPASLRECSNLTHYSGSYWENSENHRVEIYRKVFLLGCINFYRVRRTY